MLKVYFLMKGFMSSVKSLSLKGPVFIVENNESAFVPLTWAHPKPLSNNVHAEFWLVTSHSPFADSKFPPITVLLDRLPSILSPNLMGTQIKELSKRAIGNINISSYFHYKNSFAKKIQTFVCVSLWMRGQRK